MACPSVASLNSLAEVLRQAQPLYEECRLILNYLDDPQEATLLLSMEKRENDPGCNPASKGAASISLTVFEHMRCNKRLV